jgi:hypothetical protein
MTALQSDVDFLAHFGVKGMKWGVRNERRMEKKDAKWAQKQKNYKTIIKVNNTAAVRANADVQYINARYSGVDLTKPSAKTTKYYKEVEKNWNDHVARAASELGVSPSGRRKMSVKIDMYTKDFVMDDVDVTHSDLQKMLIIRDESGAVIEFKLAEPLEHSNALSEDLDFLAHFGVKGMKWGVRKEARVRTDSSTRPVDRRTRASTPTKFKPRETTSTAASRRQTSSRPRRTTRRTRSASEVVRLARSWPKSATPSTRSSPNLRKPRTGKRWPHESFWKLGSRSSKTRPHAARRMALPERRRYIRWQSEHDSKVLGMHSGKKRYIELLPALVWLLRQVDRLISPGFVSRTSARSSRQSTPGLALMWLQSRFDTSSWTIAVDIRRTSTLN